MNLEANTFDTFKVEPSDYTGKRILLVEDNELNREIGVEILQMTGAEVETAENGKIAVEKVEVSPKGSYDFIFMDIQMPVMNGSRQLQQSGAFRVKRENCLLLP